MTETPRPRKPVGYIADHIRRVLKDGGSAPHAAEVQWFFNIDWRLIPAQNR